MVSAGGRQTAAPSRHATQDSAPTHIRWRIAALLTLITSLTYIDRLNLSIAGKHIQDEFHFSTQTMGWILSGFVLGYAIFQVPGGWAGDRFGPRRLLTFAMVWWSIFTAVTAFVPQLPAPAWMSLPATFFVARFLIGVGEAAALPNSNKVIASWMGQTRRGLGNSIFLMGVGLGGTVSPALIAYLAERYGWRVSFIVCGFLGLALAIAWHLYATNRPEEHPRVNAAELQIIQSARHGASAGSELAGRTQPSSPPWRRILSNRSVWMLMLSYFCEGYPNYIYYTWFFLYLVRVRGLSVQQGGFWGAGPFLAVVMLAPLGGWLSDRAVSRYGRRRGRRTMIWVGMTASALLLASGAHAANTTLAIVLLSGAMGFNIFATVTWWATCIDLTRNFSGSLSAMMNTWGNIGGWISPILTAYIATRWGWTQALDFAALITLGAPFLWIFVNADEDLEAHV
jgi:ACS family glucarate transporter-like MFS transporter